MAKDFTIEFVIDGKVAGKSHLTAMGKTLLTTAAEDEFYAVLRKNEKSLLDEAADEEKSDIIDNLTPAQDEKLKEAHAKEYHGTDDDMPDAYDDYLVDIDLDELKKILA